MNLSSSLDEVYAYVHREEKRRGVMNQLPSIEKSALVSTSTRGGQGGNIGRGCGGRFSYSSNDKTTLNVNIEAVIGTPKISVTISMDAPKTWPHVHFYGVGLTV